MISPDSLAERHPELVRARRLLVGYSGGLDSSVLLHLVRRAFPETELLAVHVDHGLSPFAHDWRRHCEDQCARLGIPIITELVTLPAGSEMAAREARYAAYRRHLQPGDILLQAHHADDQAETVLFRLLRGAGVRGLAGIPLERTLEPGRLLRPLLNCRRSELEAYARHHGLGWVEDESNQQDHYDRNYLRLAVLPAIEKRWPNAVAAISNSAAWCRDSELLLDDLAQSDLQAVGVQNERAGWSIDEEAVSGLPERRRNNLLRYWARTHGLPVPGINILKRIEPELLAPPEGANPLLRWSSVSLRRFRRRLYLLPDDGLDHCDPATVYWSDFPQPLRLPNGFQLSAEADASAPLRLSANATLEVQFRQGGERCTPHWRQHSHPLKKLLQEVHLEPWLRTQVPLLYCGGALAAVGDLWVCRPFAQAASEGEESRKGWRLRWYRPDTIG